MVRKFENVLKLCTYNVLPQIRGEKCSAIETKFGADDGSGTDDAAGQMD